MSPEVTHVVAEVENSVHTQVATDASCWSLVCRVNKEQVFGFFLIVLISCTQELKDLVHRYPQAVPVKKAWLEVSFSKQQKVNTEQFTHFLS